MRARTLWTGCLVLTAACCAAALGREDPPLTARTGGLDPVLERTFPIADVRGAVDGTGISGRIDHMRYDAATQRLFVACVANGSVEVIDLKLGKRVGTLSGLRGPQGVAIHEGSLYVATGGDGKIHQFDAQTLALVRSNSVGDDADNVRVADDGKIWVSFGGGLAAFDARTLAHETTFSLPRMPEGFQVHPTRSAIFANLPAGKRSVEDGSVLALSRPDGRPLWERRFVGRAGNFPMVVDAEHERLFVVSRSPPRLICLSALDGSVLGEAECPPQSDDLIFDGATGRVAVIGGGSLPTADASSGAGAALDLFRIDPQGRPSRVATVALPPHTRTGTLAEDRHTLYVGVPAAGDRPAKVREYRLPD